MRPVRCSETELVSDVLDVRTVPPQLLHQVIIAVASGDMQTGEALLVLNLRVASTLNKGFHGLDHVGFSGQMHR